MERSGEVSTEELTHFGGGGGGGSVELTEINSGFSSKLVCMGSLVRRQSVGN